MTQSAQYQSTSEINQFSSVSILKTHHPLPVILLSFFPYNQMNHTWSKYANQHIL